MSSAVVFTIGAMNLRIVAKEYQQERFTTRQSELSLLVTSQVETFRKQTKSRNKFRL